MQYYFGSGLENSNELKNVNIFPQAIPKQPFQKGQTLVVVLNMLRKINLYFLKSEKIKYKTFEPVLQWTTSFISSVVIQGHNWNDNATNSGSGWMAGQIKVRLHF